MQIKIKVMQRFLLVLIWKATIYFVKLILKQICTGPLVSRVQVVVDRIY